MSGRNPEDYLTEAEAAEAEVRRGSDDNFVVSGYSALDGKGLPVPGDRKFPFVKDPPDVERAVQYLENVQFTGEGNVQNPIPLVAAPGDYAIGDPIDVGGRRLLMLWIEYYRAGSGVLSLVPEGSIDEAGFYPIGLVDSALTTPSILPAGAWRETHPTELRLGTGATTSPTVPVRQTLVFDVGVYKNFRFRYGDVASGASGLNLYYTLMR